MSAVGRWGKRPTFFGPPVSFRDFSVTMGVGSSGHSGMEHFGILKLDFFWKCFFFWSVSWTCGTKQNEYQKSTSSPTPPQKKKCRNIDSKMPETSKMYEIFWKKIIFSHFLGAAASHIAQEKRFVVRIPRTVPDVQWLLCCSFGIDTTRWLNHLYLWKYSWKPRESSQSFGKRKDILTPPSMREHRS